MLAKLTVKNQLTLPKAIMSSFGGVEYFEISTDGESITLKPLQANRAGLVRQKLAQLGIVEQDVSDALDWARDASGSSLNLQRAGE